MLGDRASLVPTSVDLPLTDPTGGGADYVFDTIGERRERRRDSLCDSVV